MKSLREKIYNFIKEKYNITPKFLWEKYPDYAVFKHDYNNKWFALVMNVPKQRLKLDGDGTVDILNIKCNPTDISLLLLEEGFLPAYHMDKTNWISVLLDKTCEVSRIEKLIDNSFNLTFTKQNVMKQHK